MSCDFFHPPQVLSKISVAKNKNKTKILSFQVTCMTFQPK
uniref:Uncharacterized protein n=1 Tax=Anguilla anguilla TaxID=7936 RepID=A0A0E9RKI2_ANGAN